MVCLNKRVVVRLVILLTFISYWSNGNPIRLIENKGQWKGGFDFGARIPGGFLKLSKGTFEYSFLDQSRFNHHQPTQGYDERDRVSSGNPICGHIVRTEFLGSNEKSILSRFGQSSDYFNFFLGKENWQSKAYVYQGGIYSSFYDGIDLKVYSSGDHLKYDFVVSPGVSVGQIQWKYAGTDQVELRNGEILVNTSITSIKEMRPVAYQIIDGKKVLVKCEYVLCDGTFSFSVGEYNLCYELVIDPILIFSTYSGFSADNWGSTATPGEHGTLYSSGVVNLGNVGGTFPATPGTFQTNYGGNYDVAIYKYDSIGHNLIYTCFLGGFYSESPHSLVLDEDDNLLILGTTSSFDFPVTAGALGQSYSGGVTIFQTRNREIPIPYENGSDIFIAKISPDGTNLLASTYFGGASNDGLNPSDGELVKNYGDPMRGDIITEKTSGDIFVSTVSSSSGLVLSNSFNTTYHGGNTDAMILRFKSDLSQLVWGAFVGGSGDDSSHTIQIDNAGNIYIAGGTTSSDFPIVSTAYQSTHAGGADGWIAKMKGDGSQILSSTFTGTSSFDQVYFLDIDQSGFVYVYGQTSGTFPVTSGVYSNPKSGQFIQKFSNNLDQLKFSTVFGSGIGIPNISPTAFLVNDCNNIYVAGWGGVINNGLGFWNSTTHNMSVTPDAVQKTTNGSDFYFMVLADDAKHLVYATYLGGGQSGTHVDGGTCRFDKRGVVYHSVCAGCWALNSVNHSTSDFPTTVNAWSRVNGSQNCNNAAFKFDLASLRAHIQTNNIHLNQPGIAQVCLTDKIVFQNESISGQYYYWNLGDGTAPTKTDTSLIAHQYSQEGQYTVRLKVVDEGTCAKVDSTQVIVNVYKPVGVGGPDQMICANTTTQITASGGVNYQWSTSDNSFTSSQANPTVGPAATTDYFVTITDVHGCEVQDTVKVKVVSALDVKMKTQLIFNCVDRPTLVATNLSDPALNLFFDFGDGTTSDEINLSHQYQKDGTYQVKLVGITNGCIFDQVQNIPVYQLLVPNVFTPDQSQGINDSFKIKYIDHPIVPGAEPSVPVSIRVYNRWGKLVYSNNDYRNDWTAKDVDAGVYYYETEVRDVATCKGWVQIIK